MELLCFLINATFLQFYTQFVTHNVDIAHFVKQKLRQCSRRVKEMLQFPRANIIEGSFSTVGAFIDLSKRWKINCQLILTSCYAG